MKKWLLGTVILVLILGLEGCVFFRHKALPAGRLKNSAQTIFPPYSGPKARVAIADFDVKASKATFEIGSELREMLVAAMIESNRFIIVGRQAQPLVTKDQEPAGFDTADLIIAAILTKFEPQASGGRSGIGGGGGVGSGVLGGLLGANLNKAHMGLDIRILNATNSESLSVTYVQSQAADVSGSIMEGLSGSLGLAGELATYAKTPMEKVIRVCIIETVRYLSQAISAEYYKY